MIELVGIGLTDEVNLNNVKFTIEGMCSAYNQVWDEGIPFFANHDHTKHCGWAKSNGIYLEPGKAYLTNTFFIGENESERKELLYKSNDYLYKVRVSKRQQLYDQLLEQLNGIVSGDYVNYWMNAVCVYDKDIVKRAIPDFCKLIKDDLVPLSELKILLPGVYQVGNFIIFAHVFFRRGFTRYNTLNEPFLKSIEKLANSHNAKIAIDMDCIGLLGTEEREIEQQYWWGPKFDDDLTKIPYGVTVYNNENYDGYLSDILKTEFGWYEQDEKHTFECEEIINHPNVKDDDTYLYGCRFVHSMVNNITGLPCHLDGAVRAYTEDKMIERIEKDIKKVNRDTIYTKIWRIDGDIKIELWKDLISNYYRDNMLVGEYFDGKDKKIDMKLKKNSSGALSSKKELSLNDFKPTNFNSGDGLRINISYKAITDIADEYNVIVRPYTYYRLGDEMVKFYDSESITIIKELEAKGLHVRLPYCPRIAFEDMIFNFPIFICKSVKEANIINQSISSFCEKWIELKNDKTISYSLLINYETKAILISFVGHINDFHKLFISKIEFPNKEDEINLWINKVYKWMNNFPFSNENPEIFKLLSKAGILSIKRNFFNQDNHMEISKDGDKSNLTIKMDKEIYDFIKKNNIKLCAYYKINRCRCSLCGNDYLTCKCIKFIDPDITEYVEDYERIGFIWTNRPSEFDKKIIELSVVTD